MRIVLLSGAMPHYNFGLHKVSGIITGTLSELGVEVSEINIPLMQIYPYDGIKLDAAEEIVKELRTSDGVIFTATVSPYSFGAAMLMFFEHLAHDDFGDALKGKNCMVALLSTRHGVGASVGEALQHYANIIQSFGGYDAVRVALNETHTAGDEITTDVREIIEKQVEDYYRIARQNRKFLLPQAYTYDLSAQPEDVMLADNRPKTTVSEIYQKLNLDALDETQKQDINEITSFFAEKYVKVNDTEPASAPQAGASILKEELNPGHQQVTPRVKTCHQLTSSLPHYFQPQLAGGLNEVIQLSISGDEAFSGYLTITGGECDYQDGQSENPDITIISDCTVWADILKGKMTAQKAFMVGQLKVRGNFVLLTKFEQLFSRL